MSGERQEQGRAAGDRALRTRVPELLDLLIEQVVDYAIFVLDRDGNIASWNAGAQRIKGYAPDEIIGKPYEIFFTEEDRRVEKPRAILESARRQGRWQEEGWRVRKDGQRFWASIVVTALTDDAGELQGFAKITRDLTERRQAEEAERRTAEELAGRRQAELDAREMQRHRDQLDLILRSVAEGVLAQTADGGLVFANDAAAQLCGFGTGAEMLGATSRQILDEFELFRDDGSPFPREELPARFALAGQPANAIVRFRSKRTGEERWSVVSAAPVLDAGGRVELAVSVFRDFTDRRRTENAWQLLASVSAALGSSLDYAATLAHVTDLAVPAFADWCGVEIVNAAGELQQLAVAHSDPRKRELAREWRRRWPPRPTSLPARVARSGSPEMVAEITDAMVDAAITDADERRVFGTLGLRSIISVPLLVDDRPFGVVSFATAESGRRYTDQDLILATEIARRAALAVENARAYAEARSAIEIRDNFLAIASHELRTPLAGLTMLIGSLAKAIEQGRMATMPLEKLEERLRKADRFARQLARLVDRLLDVNRLTTRDVRLERESVDVAEVVRDVVARFEDVAAERGVNVEVDVQGATVGFLDRGRLDQVVTNLVSNALKYGAGSPVRIALTSGWLGQLRMTVSDQGPGIATEDQARIFSQYERAAGDDQAGMGLGLWLVQRIVTAHGGTVSLDSAPGKGSTFKIILPVRPELAPAA